MNKDELRSQIAADERALLQQEMDVQGVSMAALDRKLGRESNFSFYQFHNAAPMQSFILFNICRVLKLDHRAVMASRKEWEKKNKRNFVALPSRITHSPNDSRVVEAWLVIGWEGDALSAACDDAVMTHAALARKSGYGESSVGKWLAGKRCMSVGAALKLADILHVSGEELTEPRSMWENWWGLSLSRFASRFDYPAFGEKEECTHVCAGHKGYTCNVITPDHRCESCYKAWCAENGVTYVYRCQRSEEGE